MPVTCPRCSRPSPDGSAYCLACGTPLATVLAGPGPAHAAQQPAGAQARGGFAAGAPGGPSPYGQGQHPGGAPAQAPRAQQPPQPYAQQPAYAPQRAYAPQPQQPAPQQPAPQHAAPRQPVYAQPQPQPYRPPQQPVYAPQHVQGGMPVYGQPAYGVAAAPAPRAAPRGGLSLGCGVAILVAVLGVLGAGAILIYTLIHKVDDEARAASSGAAPGPDGPGTAGGSLASRVERQVGPYKLEKVGRSSSVPAEIDSVTIEYRGEGVSIEHTLIAAASPANADEAVRAMLAELRRKYPTAEVQEGPIHDSKKNKTGYMVRALVQGEELFFWCRDTLVAVAEGPKDHTRRFVGALSYGAS
ncbi:MAG: zinc ribbon domain-containing protein [Polyangiaceae bacterium]|nr:zinc ribbon domain-containing protein [Polyangiaceae bacterium]